MLQSVAIRCRATTKTTSNLSKCKKEETVTLHYGGMVPSVTLCCRATTKTASNLSKCKKEGTATLYYGGECCRLLPFVSKKRLKLPQI